MPRALRDHHIATHGGRDYELTNLGGRDREYVRQPRWSRASVEQVDIVDVELDVRRHVHLQRRDIVVASVKGREFVVTSVSGHDLMVVPTPRVAMWRSRASVEQVDVADDECRAGA